MMKKCVLIYGVSALALLGGMAVSALAQTPQPDPGGPIKLHIEIRDNGRVLVRGPKVTSIATSTINAALTWEGGASIPWVIITDGSTEYTRRNGGNGALSEFAIGHIISFSGWLVPASTPTVRADVVRNWSVEKEEINSFGVIKSVNPSAKSFLVETDEKKLGIITVLVSDATGILKGKATTTFAALKVGDRVGAKGIWDRVANTLLAKEIKVHTENRRTFENGRLKTLPGATKPTSMVVIFGKLDYTVNISVDTAVINKNWAPANLSDFKASQHIRVYGAADGTTIDATVVRNMDLK
ncbi:MAG: hypothetical protein G01um101429_531 [Parcubacteria group bacterium Gr01-1014_29]|nr:MAG: hypothetical protein G01um101429_531 [Parcubacteria group bacterium Gr01-1014_29]